MVLDLHRQLLIANIDSQTREAQARMEEMRSLIGQRHGLRGVRPHSVIDPPMPSSSSTSSSSSGMSFDPSEVQHWFKTANEFVDNAESDLNRASGNYSKLEDALRHFAKLFKEVHRIPFLFTHYIKLTIL